MDGHECAGFYFFSNFDSANLHQVELVNSNTDTTVPSITGKAEPLYAEFNLWTRPDCCGTEFENGNRTWFYFGIKGTQPSALVRFNLVDLNKQAKLYSQGMGPVYRILPGKPHWDRIYDKPTFTNEKNVFTLSFKCRMPENMNGTLYLAFTYPHSYSDIQHRLDLYDNRFKTDPLNSKDDIYYVREKVCMSLEGRRMDMVTVTSYHNISAEREERLQNLFPDTDIPRPYRFTDKKIIFVSARVHPGETPSSFVFNGLLSLLLTREDQVAIILRRNYVFKFVPCLNPDGVYNGHYRTDTRGVNLNRVYITPNLKDHPTIHAARALIRYYHYGYEKPEENTENEGENNLLTEVSHMTLDERKKRKLFWCWKCKANILHLEENNTPDICKNCGEPIQIGDCTYESGLFLYLDMHGHASKKGIFMYGNHFEDIERSIECMLLPKIMSLNNHNFHFTACNFTERNMYIKDKRDGMSKEGSGRVAVFKLTGLVHSYTLECNYNTGRLVNVLPPTIKETTKATPHLLFPPKYTPSIFEEVGRTIGSSILDLTSQNPFTRLPHSEYHSLNGLREWLRLHCNLEQQAAEVRATPAPKLKLRPAHHAHAQPRFLFPNSLQSSSILTATALFCLLVSGTITTVAETLTSLLERTNDKLVCSAVAPREPTIHHNVSEFLIILFCLLFSGLFALIAILQVKPPRSVIAKSRSISKYAPKKLNLKRGNNVNNKKDKSVPSEALQAQPSCSNVPVPSTSSRKSLKTTKSLTMRSKKEPTADKTRSISAGGVTHAKTTGKKKEERKFSEIRFIKDAEGKKVIAKYCNDDDSEEDNLIVSWDAANCNPQVFTQKTRVKSFLSSTSKDRQRSFRVHNFQRSTASSFNRSKWNKRLFKKAHASNEQSSKGKKKLLKKASRHNVE